MNQRGFSHHIIILALFLIVVVSFAGYKVASVARPAVAAVPIHSGAAVIPASIKTTADLQTTASVLDQSSSQLDTSLDDTTLDADLNAML